MHVRFEKNLNHIYENNRPSECETYRELYNNSKTREEVGYVNEHYVDTRRKYMSPLVKQVMKKVKKELRSQIRN